MKVFAPQDSAKRDVKPAKCVVQSGKPLMVILIDCCTLFGACLHVYVHTVGTREFVGKWWVNAGVPGRFTPCTEAEGGSCTESGLCVPLLLAKVAGRQVLPRADSPFD
jgi:hypothetical protein